MNVLGVFGTPPGRVRRMRTLRREGASREVAKYGEENVAPLPDIPDGVNQKPTWVSSPGASSFYPAVRWR